MRRAPTPLPTTLCARRVETDQLPGGVLLVAGDGRLLHRFAVGGIGTRTVMPIASASKWLTSATLMTFVDQGMLSLDDPVAKYLPSFSGEKATITVRELLSHTSGLPSAPCEGDPSTTLRDCATPRRSVPAPTARPAPSSTTAGWGS